jgi:UDPglucose 6-dehydrogenase
VIIYEPSLREMVIENMHEGRLIFSQDICYGIENSLLIFITVDTPANDDGSTDLTHVFCVAENIGQFINSDKHIIVKSTVPVGTCEKVKSIISRIQMEKQTQSTIEVASNPEFLKEGSAVNDFMHPDRIVIGSDNREIIRLMKELYTPVVHNTQCPLIIMDPKSAEITKYAANCMLATRISFINELAKLCEMIGARILLKLWAGLGMIFASVRSFSKLA